MGIVYRATQVALGRPVALKLIAANFAGDRSFRERFKREWETAASIDHPNVIPVYEAGEAEEHLFIAMRYVEGLDLANLLAREPELAPDRAVRIIAQVASALDAAHARGLVHRDVKPANVLIGAEEHVYLTDFGLTKHASQDALTKTGLFVGSVDYAAPEQIRGEAMDARTDVYSLGCVLYQTLTKRIPYDKPADVAKMYAHVSEPPPLVSEARLDGATAFDAVVAKAMAKEPDDRYQSAGELATAAQDALKGRAARSTTAQHKKRRSAAHKRIAKGSDPANEQVSRRTKVAIGIALPAILVAGLAAAGLAASGVIGGSATTSPRRRSRRRRPPRRPPRRRPRPRVAPPTGQPKAVATIKVGKGPDGVAVSGGHVFVANQQAGTLSRHRPRGQRGHRRPDRRRARAPTASRPARASSGWPARARTPCGASRPRARSSRPRRSPSATGRRRSASASSSSGWPTSTTTRSTASTARPPAVVGSPIGVGSKPSGHLRRPPLRLGGQQRRRHRHPHRPVDGRGRRRPDRGRQGAARRDRDRELRVGRELRRRHRHPPGPQDRQGASARPRSAATRASWPSATASCG